MKDYIKKHRGFYVDGKPSACYEYLGAKDDYGYGRVNKNNHLGEQLWHRYRFKKRSGTLQVALVVAHLCNNPPCGRFSHLSEQPQIDNVRYGLAGKHRNHKRKVSTVLARKIYECSRLGIARKTLSKEFKLSMATIKSYAWINPKDRRGKHTTNRKRSITASQRTKAILWHQKHVPIAEIASRIGIHSNNVRLLLKVAGVYKP